MNDEDILVRQIDPAIHSRDFGIVPLGNLAKKYAGERFRREVEFLVYAGQIVRGDIGSQDSREVQNWRLCLPEQFIAHRTIGSAEVHCAFEHLADAAARTYALVIDLDLREFLV